MTPASEAAQAPRDAAYSHSAHAGDLHITHVGPVGAALAAHLAAHARCITRPHPPC